MIVYEITLSFWSHGHVVPEDNYLNLLWCSKKPLGQDRIRKQLQWCLRTKTEPFTGKCSFSITDIAGGLQEQTFKYLLTLGMFYVSNTTIFRNNSQIIETANCETNTIVLSNLISQRYNVTVEYGGSKSPRQKGRLFSRTQKSRAPDGGIIFITTLRLKWVFLIMMILITDISIQF